MSPGACVLGREADNKHIIHGEGQIVISTTKGNVMETDRADGRWLTHGGRQCRWSRQLSGRQRGAQ